MLIVLFLIPYLRESSTGCPTFVFFGRPSCCLLDFIQIVAACNSVILSYRIECPKLQLLFFLFLFRWLWRNTCLRGLTWMGHFFAVITGRKHGYSLLVSRLILKATSVWVLSGLNKGGWVRLKKGWEDWGVSYWRLGGILNLRLEGTVFYRKEGGWF